MYVVVAYDASPEDRENLRSILMPRLNWIQASVFAGELTKTAVEDLYYDLTLVTKSAKVVFWIFDRPPEARYLGAQEDQESLFF